MANKTVLKMPEEYFQNAAVNDDEEDLLTSEEENARKEVADYMENHYMEECRDDYKNNSTSKEDEKNDPFMTGLAVVCSAALVSSIIGGISTFFTNRKVNKILKNQQNN